jgi:hypothetical protein
MIALASGMLKDNGAASGAGPVRRP